MTLDELTTYIESQFPCVMGEPRPYCPTGEPYIVIGQPQEGAPYTIIRDCESDAIEAAKAAFDVYAEGKTGTLYWRTKPRIDHQIHRPASSRQGVWTDPVPDAWRVYMRLVITDQEEML